MYTEHVPRTSSQLKKNLIVRNNTALQRINLAAICYIEVSGHTLTYHTTRGSVFSTGAKTIKALEKELADDGFARCNQCYLVNLRYVESLGRETALLRGGEVLRISRNRRQLFAQAVMQHWETPPIPRGDR